MGPPRGAPPEPGPLDAPRLAAIVGPTASGKSTLAAAVAERIGAEIVSADSQQVYRGFDVGTAKPTGAELARVPHHLISCVDPGAEMNAAEWAARAIAAIDDIRRRGRQALVVGGTGLYLRALLFGVAPVPPANAGLRAGLEDEMARHGPAAIHRRLEAIDPETARTVPPGDRVRIVRALEIHALTGERPSVVRRRHGFSRLRYRVRAVGVTPPRPELYARVDARARAMFTEGLVDEVRALVAAGHADAPAMRSLGYRHAFAVVRGETSLVRAVAAACRDTRRYAKRQLTWFRAESYVEWLPWPVDTGLLSAEFARFFRGTQSPGKGAGG